jgi:hypothetical protein
MKEVGWLNPIWEPDEPISYEYVIGGNHIYSSVSSNQRMHEITSRLNRLLFTFLGLFDDAFPEKIISEDSLIRPRKKPENDNFKFLNSTFKQFFLFFELEIVI